MRILIAEDDLTSRLFMTKYMEKFGTCDVASNGLEAIDNVSEAISLGSNYELICLDIMMPKVDGMQALKAIREIEKTNKALIEPAKVIMTTALNDKATVEEAYALGAEAYAWKPIDVDKLKEVIKSLGLIEE